MVLVRGALIGPIFPDQVLPGIWGMGKIVFSSDQLPPGLNDRQRFLAWRELHNEYFGRTDLQPSEGPFEARMTFVATDDVALSHGGVTFQQSEHGGSRANAVDEERMGVIINIGDGPYRIQQRSRDEILQPGATMLVTPVDPVRLTVRKRQASWVMLAVPRQALVRAVPSVEDFVGSPLKGNNDALTMLLGYATVILRQGGFTDPLMNAHAARTMTDLVALAAGAAKDAAALARAAGLRAARIEAILREIALRYTDHGFDVAAVCARFGLSARYVQDLLQSTGGCFSDRVLELRLRHAFDLLAAPNSGDQKISDIAFSCGFDDLSYFHRCFRRSFGMTPAGVRVV